MKYPRGLLSKLRSIPHKYPYSVPLTLFLLGLAVFSSSAYYNLFVKGGAKTEGKLTTISTKETETKSDEGEVAGTETELSPTPTDTDTTSVPSNNIKSTPTPTEKPSEVKEIHTKETIEEQVITVVTATPTLTPTITPTPPPTPTPTPTPTLASTPLSADIECTKNGDKITVLVSANQTLKWCELGVSNNSGGSIGTNRFDPKGNSCSGEYGGNYNSCYASISSLSEEVITLGKSNL